MGTKVAFGLKPAVLVFIVGYGLKFGLNSLTFIFIETVSIFLFYAWPFKALKAGMPAGRVRL